jgi:cell wall-associated NlpC family hydrolase
VGVSGVWVLAPLRRRRHHRPAVQLRRPPPQRAPAVDLEQVRQPKTGTPECNALKAEWNRKLAADAFVDIERPKPFREGPSSPPTPRPGDLVIFDHGHGLWHVAIVTGSGTSIAGNTSPNGKSRNGTGVFEHSYDPADPKIEGYVRIG